MLVELDELRPHERMFDFPLLLSAQLVKWWAHRTAKIAAQLHGVLETRYTVFASHLKSDSFVCK